MLGKITKAAVDKLEPGSLIWDTNLSGFGVRRQLRHPHYIIRYRFGGKQKFVTIGKHGAWTPETACARDLSSKSSATCANMHSHSTHCSFPQSPDATLPKSWLALRVRAEWLRVIAFDLHSPPFGVG
jgi:hypothetical protein